MVNNSILDTNVIIEYFKGNSKVVEFINNNINELRIPYIVVGELYYRAYNSTNFQKHFKQINDFLSFFEILFFRSTLEIEQYSILKEKFKKIGKPIPENDIWIASLAISNKMTLISNDKHFYNVVPFGLLLVEINYSSLC